GAWPRSCGSGTTAPASIRPPSAPPGATWGWCPCATVPPPSAAPSPSRRRPASAPSSKGRSPVADAIRVLVGDDHGVVRRGLRTLLEIQDDIEVVGEAADGAEGVALAGELSPDVILMDVKMPGTDGVEALRGLSERGSPARVLVVTSFTEQRTVIPAL